MRDYLTQDEKMQMIAIYHLAKRLELVINNQSAFRKEEVTNYKKSLTWLLKGCEGVLQRLDVQQAKSVRNLLDTTTTYVDYKSVIERMMKGLESDIGKGYDDNSDYFDLVEHIFFNNCRNCTKCKDECSFYGLFEGKNIPNLDGEELQSNCKYAYKERK